jgi:hypothetical protein
MTSPLRGQALPSKRPANPASTDSILILLAPLLESRSHPLILPQLVATPDSRLPIRHGKRRQNVTDPGHHSAHNQPAKTTHVALSVHPTTQQTCRFIWYTNEYCSLRLRAEDRPEGLSPKHRATQASLTNNRNTSGRHRRDGANRSSTSRRHKFEDIITACRDNKTTEVAATSPARRAP